MKIGIDLDGVVIDSEKSLRVYQEIYDVDVIGGNNFTDKSEVSFRDRYNWNEEQKKGYMDRYVLKNSAESNVMPGFKQVYKLLREAGHEFVVVTARGEIIKEMKEAAQDFLIKHDITFDKYYYRVSNKLEICQKENVDIMIDDNYKIIQTIANAKIKTIYFRDTNLKQLEKNEYIKEVSNWGEIYRYIKTFE